MRALLRSGGVGQVILGQFLRARAIAKERMLDVNLGTEEGHRQAIQLQAQAKGLDLAINIIFDIANFGLEEEAPNE